MLSYVFLLDVGVTKVVVTNHKLPYVTYRKK